MRNRHTTIDIDSKYGIIEPINESQKIDIICYHDSHHNCLYDTYFYPTYDTYLKSHFNLYNYTEDNSSAGHFESKKWSEILLKRFDILRQYIDNNQNKWAIFSDVDIVFLQNIYNNIIYHINNSKNINIFYMPENIKSAPYDINGGFFLFKCCDEISEWFRVVQELSKRMSIPNDQITAKQLLRKNKFTNSLLDPSIFMTNNNHPQIIKSNIKSIKVFHATSAHNIIEKNLVLSAILSCKEASTNRRYLYNKNLWCVP